MKTQVIVMRPPNGKTANVVVQCTSDDGVLSMALSLDPPSARALAAALIGSADTAERSVELVSTFPGAIKHHA